MELRTRTAEVRRRMFRAEEIVHPKALCQHCAQRSQEQREAGPKESEEDCGGPCRPGQCLTSGDMKMIRSPAGQSVTSCDVENRLGDEGGLGKSRLQVRQESMKQGSHAG